MKRFLSLFILSVSVLLMTVSAAELQTVADAEPNETEYFVSPYSEITHIGDPYVLYDAESQLFYMYCTGGFFKGWVSENLNSWTPLGHTYAMTEKSFATENFWGPEVYAYNGAYYMVYSASRMIGEQKRHSIGLAKAETPAGPFFDVYDRPLFAPDYSVIDASLLFDDDGRVYLFYSRDCSENTVAGKRTSQIYGIELKPDLSATIGEPVLLTTPDTSWEFQSGNTRWNEGPCVFKENGMYYLLYSANYYASNSYSVGYATASSPLGAYTKYANNPILKGDGVSVAGTGHCNVFRSPDGKDLYMVYHAQTDVANPSGNRKPCIDKLIVGADGTLRVSGPSLVMQPTPSGVNAIYRLQNSVTITSTYATALGEVDNLCDGVISYSGVLPTDLYRFTIADGGCIQLQFATPTDLHAIWVYGIKYTALTPKDIYAVVNDTYKTAVKAFPSTAMEPAILSFASLPEDVLANNVKLYFTAQDTASSMGALSEIVILTNGSTPAFSAQRTYTNQFTDVAESAWYYPYVKTAYAYALANGTSQAKFSPDGKFTVAQALTVAANIHTAYNKTTVRAATVGEQWYAPYVAYCVDAGIITATQFADYNKNISRGDMATVFANILPDSEYTAVREESCPDVTSDMACAAGVAKLYKAGIVGGDAGTGNFRPNDEISRSEACVIFSRIAVKDFRAK